MGERDASHGFHLILHSDFFLQLIFILFLWSLFKEQWKTKQNKKKPTQKLFSYKEATVGLLGKGSFQGLAVPSGSGFVLCFIEHIVLFSVSTTRLAQYRQRVPYLQDETRLF